MREFRESSVKVQRPKFKIQLTSVTSLLKLTLSSSRPPTALSVAECTASAIYQMAENKLNAMTVNFHVNVYKRPELSRSGINAVHFDYM